MPNTRPNIPEIDPGQPIVADPVEAMRRAIMQQDITVTPPLVATKGPHGTSLRLDKRLGFYAQLSGTSSPYTFLSQAPTTSGGWQPGHMTGQAYEVNGVSGLGGQYVWVEPGAWNDWRFQWVQYGHNTPPTWRVYVFGCLSDPGAFGSQYAGVTVTAVYGGTTLTATTTNHSGSTYAEFPYSVPGPWTVTATAPNARWVTTSGSYTVGAGGSYSLDLTVASGYICACCLDPLKPVLHLSWVGYCNSGTCSIATTLTWDGTSLWDSGIILLPYSYSIGGCRYYRITLDTNCQFTFYSYTFGDGSLGCNTTVAPAFLGSSSCPPSLTLVIPYHAFSFSSPPIVQSGTATE